MKKIFIIFLISICFFANANANSCLIKNETSEGLRNYIKDLRKILKNISRQAKTQNQSDIYSYGIRVFNDSFNFDYLFDDIDFFSFYGKFQEIPKEVERDYKKLKNEDQAIKQIIKMVDNTRTEISKVKNICAGISGKCNFEDDTYVGDVLRNISQNHERIKDVYVKITTGQKNFTKNMDNYYLIDKNFFKDLETHYAKENNIKCSEEEKGGFWERVKQLTEEVFLNEKYAKDGIKKWKEAWALVNKINTLPQEEYEAIEKELLVKELSRQGVSGDNQINMLESLEKYNKEGGFNKNNNFITNTFDSANQRFENKFQELRDEVVKDFLENYDKKNREKLPIKDISKVQDNSDEIKDVKARIDNLYMKSLNYSSISEYDSDNLRSRLINTHIELSNSINTLIKTCKKAVKICNQQDYGNGDCGDCNW
ncbi:hypothetical protein DLH72_02975 [Candidatus Gracilibacteria bacterium]|nr:MAG: hypothetical protein DLH72_02975 [Candidatus Gracilibacteria bacterium]